MRADGLGKKRASNRWPFYLGSLSWYIVGVCSLVGVLLLSRDRLINRVYIFEQRMREMQDRFTGRMDRVVIWSGVMERCGKWRRGDAGLY